MGPWAAEEFRELARLAEYRMEQVAPFKVIQAADVLPVDPRTWAEKNLEAYGRLVEPFGESIGGDSPVAPLFAQMGPAIVGLQAGSLVGYLSTWVAAAFEAGLPQDRIGPMSLVVSKIEWLTVEGVDRRRVHVWVIANDV